MWDMWWLWVAGAILLAGVEALVPGYVFLGFALGALATGTLLGLGGPFAGFVAVEVSRVLLFFAIASCFGWAVLRLVLGVRRGQVTVFDRDVNDD